MSINKPNNYPDYYNSKEKAVMDLDKKAMKPEIAQVVNETKQSINELSLEARILLEKQLALTLYTILTSGKKEYNELTTDERKEVIARVNKIMEEYGQEGEKMKEQPETLKMSSVMAEAEMYFNLADMNRERKKYNNAKAVASTDNYNNNIAA